MGRHKNNKDDKSQGKKKHGKLHVPNPFKGIANRLGFREPSKNNYEEEQDVSEVLAESPPPPTSSVAVENPDPVATREEQRDLERQDSMPVIQVSSDEEDSSSLAEAHQLDGHSQQQEAADEGSVHSARSEVDGEPEALIPVKSEPVSSDVEGSSEVDEVHQQPSPSLTPYLQLAASQSSSDEGAPAQQNLLRADSIAGRVKNRRDRKPVVRYG